MNSSKKLVINHLVTMRKKYNLFTLERCAADNHVTIQTVRNFENHVSTNAKLMLYYINRILWELGNNELYLSNLDGVDIEEVRKDRVITIFLLTKSYYI